MPGHRGRRIVDGFEHVRVEGVVAEFGSCAVFNEHADAREIRSLVLP